MWSNHIQTNEAMKSLKPVFRNGFLQAGSDCYKFLLGLGGLAVEVGRIMARDVSVGVSIALQFSSEFSISHWWNLHFPQTEHAKAQKMAFSFRSRELVCFLAKPEGPLRLLFPPALANFYWLDNRPIP